MLYDYQQLLIDNLKLQKHLYKNFLDDLHDPVGKKKFDLYCCHMDHPVEAPAAPTLIAS
jgi:hypothetical protein